MGSAGAMESSSPHVIILGSALASHYMGCLALAKKLCALGVNITVVYTEHTTTELKAYEGLLGDENGRLRVVALPNGEGYTPNDGQFMLYLKAEERTSSYTLDCVKGLMESSQDWSPPCCAIVDSFADWVLKLTGPLMPSYILWTGGAASLSLMLHAPALKEQGIVPVEDISEAEKRKPVEMPCIPPLHPLQFIVSIRTPGQRHGVMLELCRNILELASGYLVNSVYELEAPVFDALNQHYLVGNPSSKLQSIHAVGPLSITREEPVDNTLKRDPVLEWLDKQPPASVLYVAFGSVFTLSASQLIELGLGLEASEQRFIWVVRPPLDYDPSSGLAENKSEVPQYLPPGFVDRTQERGVIITGWAPQVQILQHPATGGFFTHCGWSSVMESISANVPMLAWPIGSEQMMNSRWLVDIVGVALQVRKGFEASARREQVESAVRRLLCEDEGHTLRSNMRRLNEGLVKAAAEFGSSSRNMETFIEKLHQWNDTARYASS